MGTPATAVRLRSTAADRSAGAPVRRPRASRPSARVAVVDARSTPVSPGSSAARRATAMASSRSAESVRRWWRARREFDSSARAVADAAGFAAGVATASRCASTASARAAGSSVRSKSWVSTVPSSVSTPTR
ncbi:hypothetical protein [Saccharothrix lopnurensis]|uniref:Uncharacterized protein n=1 Tax=Saccharothrix lopnurensis TaxID=1670621 RepID=A0ABW1PA40_9PSEU